MSPFARELFARLRAADAPGIWRTDEQLDALVKYAMRAEAACAREDAREHARRVASPPPRPPPTSTPSIGALWPNRKR